MNMGIYKITNIVNGKFYIGSSVDLKKRKRDHLRELKNNIHRNERLQHSFNKYGIKNFTFEIIEYVKDRNLLIEREQYWIDEYDSSNRNIGFNINRLATGGGNYGETNGNYGRRGKKNPLSKSIAQIDVNNLEVVKVWGASIEIQRQLGIHGGNVCKLCKLVEQENVLKKSRGYYWCYEKDIPKIKTSKIFKPKKRTTTGRDYSEIRGDKNPRARSVVQLTLDGSYIETYTTVKEAAKTTGTSINGLYQNLSRGSGKSVSNGYRWMYLEEYESNKTQQLSIL